MDNNRKINSGKSAGFDAPIPGASLVETPGKFPWDKPPRIVEYEEAKSFILDRLSNEETQEKVVGLLEAEINPVMIAKIMLKAAYMEGIINPDLAEALLLPATAFIATIGEENNVEMNFDPERDPEIPHIERLKDQIKNKKNKKDENILVDEDVKDVRPLKKGLMERSI